MIKKKLPLSKVYELFDSLIGPVLNFCSEIWGWHWKSSHWIFIETLRGQNFVYSNINFDLKVTWRTLVKLNIEMHSRDFKRVSAHHQLAIETGRYINAPRENRSCLCCTMNSRESEYHFTLVCTFYAELRK